MPSPRKCEIAIFRRSDLLLADVIEVGEEQWTTDLHADPPRLQLPPGNDVRGMIGKARWHVTKRALMPLQHFRDDVMNKKPRPLKALVRGLIDLSEGRKLRDEDRSALEAWQKTIDDTDI